MFLRILVIAELQSIGYQAGGGLEGHPYDIKLEHGPQAQRLKRFVCSCSMHILGKND